MKTVMTAGLGLALLVPGSAWAFCGHYVGQPGAELYSSTSEVVLSRRGTTTTLTLTNDYEGDAADFALLIPVPPGVTEDDVQLADPGLLNRVRQYSAPRYVEYSCSDLYPRGGCNGGGCYNETALDARADSAGGGFEGQDALDVTVEEEFAVGAYEIVVLSSGDAGDLLTWLDGQGYAVSPGAEDLLGEYIEGGSQFFAAKASFDQIPLAGSFLEPLQVTYESEVFGLPIRLGTLNSPGVQDLLIYAVTDQETGSVGIANYPEVTIEGDCMVETEPEDFGAFYEAQLDDAFADEPAAWALEYQWTPSGCDPCPPGGALETEDLIALGVPENEPWNAMFTRLHVRYDADAATEDLVLYGTGAWGTRQMRYIKFKDKLTGTFPVCGEGWSEDPKTCARQGEPVQRSTVGGWLAVGLLGLFAGFGLTLRRRQRDA